MVRRRFASGAGGYVAACCFAVGCLTACVPGHAGAPGVVATPGSAAQLATIDPDAHYPEGPLWRDGKLFYVEYAQSNIKTWDGSRVTV